MENFWWWWCGIGLLTLLLLWSVYREYGCIKTYRQTMSKHANWSSWYERDFERWKSQRRSNDKRKVSLMVVLGSGGHTAEMIQVVRAFVQSVFSGSVYGEQQRLSRSQHSCQVIYVVASSDSHSIAKASHLHEQDGVMALFPYQTICIPRARYVGQSYFSSIFTTIYSIVVSCWKVLCTEEPDILVCNGPGTCVPIVVITFVRNALYHLAERKRRTRIVFIESIARVHSLSLSGRILYPFVHRFLVQWPHIRQHYPLVEYVGLCL